ncbi:MAG: hypothetical protein AAFN70_18505, partial [Planctomycetota bacterium]
IVDSTVATVVDQPLALQTQPTLTIATDRPFYEFVGRTITVSDSSGTSQIRRIQSARLVDGNMQLTVDRSWLDGDRVPSTASSYSIELASGTITGNPLDAENTLLSLTDPLDPNNPFLNSGEDLLGRQVTIVDGRGSGQSRFITGAESVVNLSMSGSPMNRYTPQTRNIPLTETPQAVTLAGDATLTISAAGDLDWTSELITVRIDGVKIDDFFGGSSGALYQNRTAQVTIPQSTLQPMLTDGNLQIEVIPSNQVNNFDSHYGSSHFALNLQFNVNSGTTTFRKEVLGDMRLTLDRGWDPTDTPDTNSTFQIPIDDAIIGRVSAIDEQPTGLPADPSFPASRDTRTTFGDAAAIFDSAEFGPEGLRGGTLQIVGGPGAGQERLIL